MAKEKMLTIIVPKEGSTVRQKADSPFYHQSKKMVGKVIVAPSAGDSHWAKVQWSNGSINNYPTENLIILKDGVEKKVPYPAFALGDWVSLPAGKIGVISGVDHWDGKKYPYWVVSGQDRACILPKTAKKIAKPKFVVAWSTEDNDPVEHFSSLESAKKFKAKILSKGVEGKKVVEAEIYKITK